MVTQNYFFFLKAITYISNTLIYVILFWMVFTMTSLFFISFPNVGFISVAHCIGWRVDDDDDWEGQKKIIIKL